MPDTVCYNMISSVAARPALSTCSSACTCATATLSNRSVASRDETKCDESRQSHDVVEHRMFNLRKGLLKMILNAEPSAVKTCSSKICDVLENLKDYDEASTKSRDEGL